MHIKKVSKLTYAKESRPINAYEKSKPINVCKKIGKLLKEKNVK